MEDRAALVAALKEAVLEMTRMVGVPVSKETVAHSGGSVERLWKQWGLPESLADKIREVHADALAVELTPIDWTGAYMRKPKP